jgi:hypothetical protein
MHDTLKQKGITTLHPCSILSSCTPVTESGPSVYHDHIHITCHQVSLSQSWWLQAEIAGRISVKQFSIALSLGDPMTVARCKLYLALSLVQRGHLVSARHIIEQQYHLARSAPVLDTQLISMCLGIWTKLKYEHHKRRTERRGKKWRGYYKQTSSLPSKFVPWMSFSFTTNDTRKSVWNIQLSMFFHRVISDSQKVLCNKTKASYKLGVANLFAAWCQQSLLLQYCVVLKVMQMALTAS